MWRPWTASGPTSSFLCETVFLEEQRTRECTRKDVVPIQLLPHALCSICSEMVLREEMLEGGVLVLSHHLAPSYWGPDGVPEWATGFLRGLRSSRRELASEALPTSLGPNDKYMDHALPFLASCAPGRHTW